MQSPSPSQTSVNTARMDLIEQYRGYGKSCFVLGASGATGSALVRELIRLKPFERVVLIGRRKLDYQDYELQQLEQRVINFDRLDAHKADFDGFDVGYCCLGATRENTAPGDMIRLYKEGYGKVDHDYVLGAAKLAKDGGAEHFHVISAIGASETSWIPYCAVKGRTDREIAQLCFDRASIYRIGALLVDREGSRPLDAIAQYVMKPFTFIAPTFITTPVDVLAKAMLMNSVQDQPSGAEVVDNRRIHALAKLCP